MEFSTVKYLSIVNDQGGEGKRETENNFRFCEKPRRELYESGIEWMVKIEPTKTKIIGQTRGLTMTSDAWPATISMLYPVKWYIGYLDTPKIAQNNPKIQSRDYKHLVFRGKRRTICCANYSCHPVAKDTRHSMYTSKNWLTDRSRSFHVKEKQ